MENVENNIHVLVVSPSYVKTNISVSGLTGSGHVRGGNTTLNLVRSHPYSMFTERYKVAQLVATVLFSQSMLYAHF